MSEKRAKMVREGLRNYLTLAGGLGELTRRRALAAARALSASGEATAEQVSALAEDLLATSRSNREALAAVVRLEIDRALGRLGLATAEEITTLTARVQRLETALREQAARPAKAAPPRSRPSRGVAAPTGGEAGVRQP